MSILNSIRFLRSPPWTSQGFARPLDGTATSANRQAIAQTLWQIGAPLIFFPGLVFVLSVIWLAAGQTLDALVARLVLAVAAVAAIAIARLMFRLSWWPCAPLSLGLGALALVLSSLIYDTSIDGQHYHFQAIYALKNGWNPIWDQAAPPAIADPATLWAIHYPRATWLFAANLLAAGSGLGAAKAINFIMLFGSALLLGGAVARLSLGLLASLLLTAVAVLNPIAVSQMLTGMNDGVFGHALLIFMVAMLAWTAFDERGLLAVALAVLTFGLNLKYSAVPIFALLSAIGCAVVLAVHGWRRMVNTGLILLGTALLAIVVLGWSPYVQNYLQFGHPFYPVMGPNAVDIMGSNTPEVLKGLTTAERFLFSLFAETHAGYASTAGVKLPLWLRPGEVRMAGGVDVRIGGFGPFFSAVILLAVVCAVLLLAGDGRRRGIGKLMLFVAAGLLASVLVMPENWWARYVPQFWYVPWCLALAAVTLEGRMTRMIGSAILVLMLADAAIVAGASVWLAGKRSAAVADQLARLQASDQSYCLSPELDQSRVYLFREAGIDARAVVKERLTCSTPETIAGYGPDRVGGMICPCPR